MSYYNFIYNTGKYFNEELKYNIRADKSIETRLMLIEYLLDTYKNYNPYSNYYKDTDYPDATIFDNVITITLNAETGESFIVDDSTYLIVDEIALEQPNEEHFKKVISRMLNCLASPVGGCNLSIDDIKDIIIPEDPDSSYNDDFDNSFGL